MTEIPQNPKIKGTEPPLPAEKTPQSEPKPEAPTPNK